MQAVVVTAKEGQVFFQNENKPEFSYYRVSQKGFKLSNNMMSATERSVLITVKTEDVAKLQGIIKEGTVLPGNIVAMESTKAFYPGQEPKRAGKDGAILTHNGQPIYRSYELDLTGKRTDEVIQHDKVEVAVSSNASASEQGA